jgi:hypothetical protein
MKADEVMGPEDSVVISEWGLNSTLKSKAGQPNSSQC